MLSGFVRFGTVTSLVNPLAQPDPQTNKAAFRR